MRVTLQGLVVTAAGCLVLGLVIYSVWLDGPKSCLDFDSRQEAQAYAAGFDTMGPTLIDVDADGRACEELPNK